MVFEQYYCIQNETAYIITFTCEQRKTDKYQQVGKNILESFIVK